MSENAISTYKAFTPYCLVDFSLLSDIYPYIHIPNANGKTYRTIHYNTTNQTKLNLVKKYEGECVYVI